VNFPLGKPILVMLIISLISGGVIAFRSEPPTTDLVLLTFAQPHADTYRSIIGEFEKQTGKTVSIQVMAPLAENSRLESMFMSGQNSRVLPDVVEVEITNVSRFLRPPVDEIGFFPLNAYLAKDDWEKRILASRLATWTKQNVVFGLPHDVHPVSLTYRQDLFEQAGIHLEDAKTWPQFQQMCLQFQDYWRARGYPTRHAIELSRIDASDLVILLLQRHVNVVDQNEKIHVNDPIVAQTLAFYAQLVAGPNQIASDAGGGSGVWTTDVLQGNLCSFLMPDWHVSDIREFAPQLAGKLRMMPLPKFDPTDAPTSTWGGTMIAITRNSQHHDDAWKLIQFLYLSRTGLDAQLKVTDILPPVTDWWTLPVFHRSDPFFGGQKIDELYINLAHDLPARYVTPVSPIAEAALSVVVDRAINYVENYGTDGLEAHCQTWLDFVAADLQRRIQHGRFDN
jgi:arabinosaccharide transport system substrate-binding protein